MQQGAYARLTPPSIRPPRGSRGGAGAFPQFWRSGLQFDRLRPPVSFSRRVPSPYLLDPGFWQDRVARMDAVNRGLMLLPRPDLSSPMLDVVEWRIKAHDGSRLWGLRGSSPFHVIPKGVCLREVAAHEPVEIDLDVILDGRVDLVFQLLAGRRLEDRVLDVIRARQVAENCGVEPDEVELVTSAGHREPDEFMIAERLHNQGFC